ncbi:MAG: family 43 glycosylhydrolase [Melioribacteraceae bacterium]|nr:family 43 glycosylhydrolase [Melioribacteraceae bacterium]
MKANLFSIIMAVCIITSCTSQEQNQKIFQPGKLWTDNNGVHINAHGGGILFHDDVYYWYGEHKIEGSIGNSAQVGVHVYSSKDLFNWHDEGIALKVVEDDSTSDIAKGAIIERPKVLYNKKTDKFVMWFHLELKGKSYAAARSGIAVSDSPAGPFEYIKSVRPNKNHWPVNVLDVHKKEINRHEVKDLYSGGDLPAHPDSLNILGRDFNNGQMARDMNLFLDDNGKAYHIYSSEENSTLHISELTDDFQNYSGKYIRLFAGKFNEAPAMFKRNGKYYLITSGCTGWAPNAARSAVAESIWGEWKELSNPCIGEMSELTFNSQSTFVLEIKGGKDQFIFMADRWNPENPIDGRYIWLPIQFEEDKIKLEFIGKWDMDFYNRK